MPKVSVLRLLPSETPEMVEFAKSEFVTRPVAVKAVVTVRLEIVGAVARTAFPVPVTDRA